MTILYNYAGRPAVSGQKHPFTDVPAGQSYTNAVIWAYNKGAVSGTTATTFSPNDSLDRAQIVQLLYNLDQKKIF